MDVSCDVLRLVFCLFLQVWSCGGSIEVIPCSKIAHIERATKPYLPDLSVTMKRNALRVAEVWMDEYKSNVNVAWNLPLVASASKLRLCAQFRGGSLMSITLLVLRRTTG